MIAKEWWEARWKFLIGAVLLLALLIWTDVLPSYQSTLAVVKDAPAIGPDESPIPKEFRIPNDPVEVAISDMSLICGWAGGFLLTLSAGILGVGLISKEVSGNTVFLLLSKPVDRTRILFGKYAVCAGILFAAAVFGGVALIISAGAQGYTVGDISIVGVALAILLLWLGSLSILGVALMFSVLFRDVPKSLLATAATTYLILAPDQWLNYSLWNEYHALGFSDSFLRKVTLFYY